MTAASHDRTRRGSAVGWQRVSALLLLVWGASVVLYGGILPLPVAIDLRIQSPLLGNMSPLLAGLGVLMVAAGVGVWRGADWARRLGSLCVVLLVGYEVWLALALPQDDGSGWGLLPSLLGGPAIVIGSAALILYGLRRGSSAS